MEQVGTYDAAVAGLDLVTARPAFTAMLQAIAGNGVRMVIVESASRFARDLIVQETGYAYLRDFGITSPAGSTPSSAAAARRPRLFRHWLSALAMTGCRPLAIARRPQFCDQVRLLEKGQSRGEGHRGRRCAPAAPHNSAT